VSDPLVISCAVTGSLATKDDNPHLPFSPAEIGQAAIEAWREGAAIVHIHAREDDGTPTGDPEYFRRAIDVIRSADCDIVVNLTTAHSAIYEDDWSQRFAALEAEPEIGSFDCGSMNLGPWIFRNAPRFLEELAQRMLDAGIKPELEIFDTGMVGNAMRLAERGLLPAPLWFQFVLGVDGGAPASARSLAQFVDMVPAGTAWSVAAVGRYQLEMNTHAIAMGGHARTGMEDNLWFSRGVPASNAMLVERLRIIGEAVGRPIATPSQARALLGLRELVMR
jgi:3-keto-5-aminohexanoate cleavage enzyme